MIPHSRTTLSRRQFIINGLFVIRFQDSMSCLLNIRHHFIMKHSSSFHIHNWHLFTAVCGFRFRQCYDGRVPDEIADKQNNSPTNTVYIFPYNDVDRCAYDDDSLVPCSAAINERVLLGRRNVYFIHRHDLATFGCGWKVFSFISSAG